MAIPSTAVAFGQPMDPQEELDFQIDVAGLLEVGEDVASSGWTLAVLAESAALGLTIMTGSGRDPSFDIVTDKLRFWLKIDIAFQTNAAWDGAGTSLGLVLTATTNSVPARKRQRTFTVTVVQQ